MTSLGHYLEARKRLIDKTLVKLLPSKKDYPSSLHEALHYSLEGGKRIRPILALAACEAVGGNVKDVLVSACAIEIIHAFSLVHDDLPCMDNDEVRRGQPTVHKKFGESTALLAGDALLNLGFELLAKDGASSSRQIRVLRELSRAVGTYGMIGGQAADLELRGKEPDLPSLEYVHSHKTGALITASLKVGGILGRGSPGEIKALSKFGEYVGFTFQIVDDIIDREGYSLIFEVKGAREEAEKLTAKAKKHLKPFGKKGKTLEALADFILNRNI